MESRRGRYQRRKCRCCQAWFDPEPHNAWHQRYCRERDCQAASHRASQWRWLRRNVTANSGYANVQRVQRWRAEHAERTTPRLDRHLFLDIRVPPTTDNPTILVRIEDRKVGVLQDLTVAQPVHRKRVRPISDNALRDVVRLGFRNWYQGRRRNEQAPPIVRSWRR